MKFLNNQQKIEIELTGTKMNFERIKEDDYVDKESLISKLPTQPDHIENRRQERLKQNKLDETFSDDLEEGKQNTITHNTNFYKEISDRNPFKKADRINHALFEENDNLNQLNRDFVSSLGSFKEETSKLYQRMTEHMQSIEDKFNRYNLEDVKDPYYANDIDSFDINLNYNTITNNEDIYAELNEEEIYYFVMNAFEDMVRFHQSFQTIYGLLNSQPKPSPQLTEKQLDTILANEDTALETIEDELLDSEAINLGAAEWWEDFAVKLDNPSKLLFTGLIPSIANSLSNEMDWNNKEYFLKEKFVSGFMSVIETKYKDKFTDNLFITQDTFKDYGKTFNEAVWNQLIVHEYIDSSGFPTEKYHQSHGKLELNMALTPSELNYVETKLTETFTGKHSFSYLDQTLVNEKTKKDIKVNDAESGNSFSISDIIGLLNQGETSDDKLDNALTAYNQLFNIYNNIIDLDAHSKTKQQIKYTYTETKKVEITIAKSGSWQEWDPNKIPTSFITKLKEQHADLDVPSDLDLNDPEKLAAFFQIDADSIPFGDWVFKNDQPVTMQFNTLEEAQSFANTILELSQSMLPLLGFFRRDNLNIHMSNTGGTDSEAYITKQSEQYLIQKTTLHRYDIEIFESAHKNIKRKTAYEIGQRMFEKSQINRMVRNNHKKTIEKYQQEKQEHEEAEFQRLRTENKLRADKKKSKKADLIRRKMAKKMLALLKQQQKEARAKRMQDNKRNNAKRKQKA